MPSHSYDRLAAHDEEEGMAQLPAYALLTGLNKNDAGLNEKSAPLIDVSAMPKDEVINLLVARVEALEQQTIKKDDLMLAFRRKKRWHKVLLKLVVAGGMMWFMGKIMMVAVLGFKARAAAGEGQ